jgi:hypothetical protein
MSTKAEPADLERLKEILAEVRSDANGVNRRSWVIVGHVENNPNVVDVIAHDTSAEASLEDFRSRLEEDQVMYCLLRLNSSVDMSTTVKFIYVHWIGENVPFVKKGRYGVVHGSVEEHFNPYHIILETGSKDDLEEQELIDRLDESSGTRSKVLEGSTDGRQMRGFTQHQVTRQTKGELKSVAPAGADVEVSPELNEAIGEVRDDKSPVTWILAGYEAGNLKKPLVLCAKGEGNMDELSEQLQDDQVMYGLYRVTDIIDDISTVKFVYIYWIGEQVKPIMKGKVSAYAGPVSKVFSPAHASLSFTNRFDISEKVIIDKVTSSSGSKSFVK